MPKEQSGLEEETNRPETEKSSGVNKVITRRGFLKTLASTVGALSAQRLFPGLGITHPSSVSAQEQSSAVSSGVPIEDGVFYSEDGVNGYKVEGPMFEIFQSIGGESTWGKAISRSWIDELGRINQAFEKGILQLSADGKGGFSVEFANIFDILHDLGKDEWLKNYRQVPPAQSWSSDKGKTWPETIQAHLTITDSYTALRAFIEANPDWINQYGLPVAIEDYGPWVSLRMQRANLQLLKTDLPYGNTGDVLVANGGTVAKEAGGIIPPQALKQQTLAETGQSGEAKKEQQTLKGLGRKLGITFGTTIVGSDPYSNPLYKQTIENEFDVFAPIDYTIEDAVQKQLNGYVKGLSKELINSGETLRLYNMFWHADYRDKPNDPMWLGAPQKGEKPSEQYKQYVGKMMEDKARWVLTNAPDVKELGFANEAMWEFQGNTGWEDSPFYRAFGEDWLIEAYVRTYKIAQELGRQPGKDLALFYGDYNYEVTNRKADFVYAQLKRLKSEAAKRLGIADAPLVVDMQLHVDLNNPPKLGELYSGDITYDSMKSNLVRFGEIGPVWIGEWSFRGDDRGEINRVADVIMRASLDSRVVKSITFWELMGVNGYYRSGNLLFDISAGSFSRTSTYNTILSALSSYIPKS